MVPKASAWVRTTLDRVQMAVMEDRRPSQLPGNAADGVVLGADTRSAPSPAGGRGSGQLWGIHARTDPDDIGALAVSAWVLGTGCGASPYLSLLNMRRLYADGRRVRMM